MVETGERSSRSVTSLVADSIDVSDVFQEFHELGDLLFGSFRTSWTIRWSELGSVLTQRGWFPVSDASPVCSGWR